MRPWALQTGGHSPGRAGLCSKSSSQLTQMVTQSQVPAPGGRLSLLWADRRGARTGGRAEGRPAAAPKGLAGGSYRRARTASPPAGVGIDTFRLFLS